MDLPSAIDAGRDMLLLSLVIAGPILGIGLIVGLIISIVQAVTQLQEQTLVFVPKMAAMMLATILLLPWIGQRLIDYSREMFGTAP